MQRAAEEAAKAHVQVWVCDAAAPPRSLQALHGGATADPDPDRSPGP